MKFKVITVLTLLLAFSSCKKVDNSPTPLTDEAVEVVESSKNAAPENSVASSNSINIAPSTAVTATPVGMNPPHGEPGHRCDIQVGAPLNSAPQSQATAPAPVQVMPQTLQAPTPVAAPVAVAPGTNPPHGQPGHRCDIEVGAPLN